MEGRVILVTIVCVFGLLLTPNGTLSTNSANLPAPQKTFAANIELTIDYGNTTRVTVTSLSGLTVFDVLNQSATLNYIQYPYGLFVDSINGVSNNEEGSGFYWQYWVNSELAPIAADRYVLSNSDRVLWRYCAPIHRPEKPSSSGTDWWIGAVLIMCIAGLAIGGALVLNRRLR